MSVYLSSYFKIQRLLPHTKARTFLYAILSGLLLGCAFPPFQLGLLGFIALLPLLLVIEQLLHEHKPRLILLLYITYFLYQGIANWWVGSWQKESDPFLMIAGIALQFGHPFFLMLPFVAYYFVRKRLRNIAMVFTFPLFYVGYEWLHSLTDASYPWLSIGYMNVNIPIIAQCADIFGVWGLSFLMTGIQSLIIWIFLAESGKKVMIGMYQDPDSVCNLEEQLLL